MDECDRSAPFIEQMEKVALDKAKQVKNYGSALVIDGERVCRDCEEPIARKRLEAQPRAVLCVECQEDRERGSKLYRR